MKEAFFQRFVNQFIWDTRSEKRDAGSIENPSIPFSDFAIWGGKPSLSGVNVTPDVSLKLSAVWRCASILSGIISYLPSKPYEVDGYTRTVAKDHPSYKLFTRRPSPLYTKTIYWERAVMHMLFNGNHYARINYTDNGQGTDLQSLELILPTSVKEIHLIDGQLIYSILGIDQKIYKIKGEEMIHVPNLGTDLFTGKSVITYAREDIGIEISRRDAGAKFWQDGGDPKIVITTQQKVSDPGRAALKETYRNARREGGAIVAPFGTDIKPISMTPADQEFIMSGNFSIASICRWFGVPLHKLSELERATFSNVESMAIEFMQDTIMPMITKIENEYTTKLYTLPSEENLELCFDINAYQRADSVAMAEANRTDIQNGIKSPNQVAAEKGLPPVVGGDRKFVQQNMMGLDQVDKVLMSKQTTPISKNQFSDTLKRQARELLETAESYDKLNLNGNGNH